MIPQVDAGTRRLLTLVGRHLDKSPRQFSLILKREINKIPWLAPSSKIDIFHTFLYTFKMMKLMPKESVPLMLSSPKFFDPPMRSFNRAYREAESRVKGRAVKTGLKMHRDMETPIVFYLVSSHQNPAEKHEPYQSTVLVDRYWRSALKDSPMLEKVEAYIRNRKIKTVQQAMGAPDYLITRPNCKHYLIPIQTKEALTSSPRSLAKRHPSGGKGTRSKSKKALWREYKASRARLYRSLAHSPMPKKKPS